MMKRFLATWLMVLSLVAVPLSIVASPVVSAVNVFPQCNGTQQANQVSSQTEICKSVANPGQAGTNPIINILRVAIQILAVLIGIAAVLMILIGGLSFITANGDAQAIARARSRIQYALIGVVVASLAQILVTFVLSKL